MWFQGAFWGLIVGSILGLIRFGLEFGYTVPPCGKGKGIQCLLKIQIENYVKLKFIDEPDPRPEFVKLVIGNVHHLHFGCMLFLITTIVTVVISLVTEPIDKNHVKLKYLFFTRTVLIRVISFSCIA